MESLIFSTLLSFLLFSFVSAGQKGVLEEGYHIPGGGGGYSQSAPSQPVRNQGVDSQIAEAKNNYDTCMRNIKGEFGNDISKNIEISIKRKECQRYMDIYENLIYSQYNVQKISGSSSNEKNNIKKSQNNIQQGRTDNQGTYYAPTGSDNLINTKTGSPMIHQGGNMYLDPQTGKVKPLN